MPAANLIAVTAADTSCQSAAVTLASQLALPLTSLDDTHFSYLLIVTPTHLELKQTQHKTNPIYVDFLSAAMTYRRKHGGGKQQLIAKAVGVSSKFKPSILDTTAGLGEDAFVLASLGCNVTMLERSPIIGTLLQDGLTRLKQNPEFKNIALNLITTNAITHLQTISATQKPDVVYLDPMFPSRTKSALVKKEMRMLRELVGNDEDAPQLLALALQTAKKRVVVKRPRLADTITEVKPQLVLSGQSGRFDVYLLSS